MQWQQRQQDVQDDDLDDSHLLHCQGNWTQASKNPELLQKLLAQEVEHGWVKHFNGDRAAVARTWPDGSAICKLNIVTAEGKEPRLVLDSSICNANQACFVPEKVSLPSNLDVRRTFSHEDTFGQWASSLDFKAARKSIKVHPREHGCLLFEVAGKLYHCIVCHFGAKFSAYWWQRAGAQMLCVTRALLSTFSHRAWLYVDDLLAQAQHAPTGHAHHLLPGRNQCTHELAQSTTWAHRRLVRVDTPH